MLEISNGNPPFVFWWKTSCSSLRYDEATAIVLLLNFSCDFFQPLKIFYLPKTLLTKSMTLAAGSVLIFFL